VRQYIQTYPDRMAQSCREFQSAALIGGKDVLVHGVACMQGDGSWKVVAQ
jgi:surface antigen